MTAIQSLLEGFFDYAGLYPPASLSLRSAANNYLGYASSGHAAALGRFIINADRLGELSSITGGSHSRFKLSVILSDFSALGGILNEIEAGAPIEILEMKYTEPEILDQIAVKVPQSLAVYVEIPLDSKAEAAVNEISRRGMHAKIRMGGVAPEAFPPVSNVIRMLSLLAKLRVPFKATAGLHHPIRSKQPLTYEAQSAKSTMHGYLNLCCAAAVLFFGGGESDAGKALQDEDRDAWRVDQSALQWRDLKWSRDQLFTLRREFFTSIGSCSFEEPIKDLEALGWL